MTKKSRQKFKYLQNEQSFQGAQFLNKKYFSSVFKGFQLPKNCLKPETALLTLLATKKRLLCNFTKTLNCDHFMGHSGKGLKFSIAIDL